MASLQLLVPLCQQPAAAIQFMLLFSRQGNLRLQKWYVPPLDKEKKITCSNGFNMETQDVQLS